MVMRTTVYNQTRNVTYIGDYVRPRSVGFVRHSKKQSKASPSNYLKSITMTPGKDYKVSYDIPHKEGTKHFCCHVIEEYERYYRIKEPKGIHRTLHKNAIIAGEIRYIEC